MSKKEKTATNNQWTSTPEASSKKENYSHKKEKTATDNQWTSTIKNNIYEE
ncbi:hypothetical protein CPAST_c27980 [Clostridium pasteurianum DSM 525 = ATCC 6013]|uniref:Uncharacterized protein n=1 Tax=Clostridium pasteurianum DSM 525 = ATCC 6013 TaxID=1262449 RepID=A0A0H3JAU4_CLOPA|nr:hypothetical protein [Clostridium pasteurianum]AJA48865.1 hypothetical protein CPAST_c27980 [Clostridium pasteurianum DSM 525 = ATCC 6013]AJA52853.1 hypothetical protein CLPA_c27980 [Clostridium pasteurianum DSM 525 = ATCC 6013]ELP60161.1 hypothetical protein F502_05977 [Clostridium pasteurianum DSM 525 = ATCC 6013]KRU11139.1 hypothetical protein CP6013_00386 [Clostridium pasteurianum DSM 525 = ATCC 6013]UZW13115.1 hypothetical protein OSC52_14835 [Clostridium pasteurianum]